jgi:hypothetical protein
MSTTKKEYYLAKSGRVYGPFDAREFELLHESGEIAKFTYLWDGERWKTLEAPPAPLPQVLEGRRQRAEKLSDSTSGGDAIRAICHDSRTAIAGKLLQVTETGAELESYDDVSGTPRLYFRGDQQTTVAFLNLFEESSERSQTLRVRLANAQKRNGKWVYQLRWERCPELLAG